MALSERLAHRISARRAIIAGMVTVAAGAVALARVDLATSLADAARLRGAPALAALTSAFGVSFWRVAGLATAAIIPALFIQGRATVSMTTLLSSGDESSAERASVIVTE
jgi:hypothetical protein